MSTAWVIAFVVLAAAVIVNLVVVVGLLRRIAPVLEGAERELAQSVGALDVPGGVPLLGRASPFHVYTHDGLRISSDELLSETTILLFMEAGCQPCRELISQLHPNGEGLDEIPLVIVIPDADAYENLKLDGAHVRIVLQPDRAASRAFQTEATPSAFVVYPGGVVLDRLVPRSWADLQLLARRQRGGDAHGSETELVRP